MSVYGTYSALAFACLSAVIPAALWCVVPRARHWSSRVAFCSLVGAGCTLLTFESGELVGKWDTLVQHFLLTHGMRQLALLSGKFVYPGAYMLVGWLAGFLLTFELSRMMDRRNLDRTNSLGE